MEELRLLTEALGCDGRELIVSLQATDMFKITFSIMERELSTVFNKQTKTTATTT